MIFWGFVAGFFNGLSIYINHRLQDVDPEEGVTLSAANYVLRSVGLSALQSLQDLAKQSPSSFPPSIRPVIGQLIDKARELLKQA